MNTTGHTPDILLDTRPQPLRRLGEELWRSRALIAALGRQDFFVRYRRASLGILWAVGLPVLQTAVLATVFSRIVKVDVGSNFVGFVLAGMTMWSFFSGAVTGGSTAIVDMSAMASKIYFPRAVLPLTKIVSGLYSFVIGVILMLVVSVFAGIPKGNPIGFHMLLVIPGILLAIWMAAGFSLILSALHVYFRDIKFLLQAGMMVWFYLSPIFYPVKLATDPILHAVVMANPVTGMIDFFRLATAGGYDFGNPEWHRSVAISVAWAAVLSLGALLLHRRYDRVFTDLL